MIQKVPNKNIRKIFKYPVPKEKEFTLNLPDTCYFLKLEKQHLMPQMWFMVDPNAPYSPRKYYLAETGEELPEVICNFPVYLGTFLVDNDNSVFHIFDIT